VCGVWCVVCGVWCVVCGVWCVVCGECYVVCGDYLRGEMLAGIEEALVSGIVDSACLCR
jgi:hypothetical protein